MAKGERPSGNNSKRSKTVVGDKTEEPILPDFRNPVGIQNFIAMKMENDLKSLGDSRLSAPAIKGVLKNLSLEDQRRVSINIMKIGQDLMESHLRKKKMTEVGKHGEIQVETIVQEEKDDHVL
jgi:hypothetical protein